MPVLQTITGNWAELANAGIALANLSATLYIIRTDREQRKLTNQQALTEGYYRVWEQRLSRPELRRVEDSDADLDTVPITDSERIFVRMLVHQLHNAWRTDKLGGSFEIEKMNEDIRKLFTLPVPNAVWESLIPFQNKDFVIFVESARNPMS